MLKKFEFMKYTENDFLQRYRSRSDLSSFVTHLTRGNDELNSIEVLLKILDEKVIHGSGKEGYIMGKNKATCFQEAPPYGVAQNVYHEQQRRLKSKTIDNLIEYFKQLKIKDFDDEKKIIEKLVQLTIAWENESKEKRRYSGIGLMFRKSIVFEKGGRPVIYEGSDLAKEMISEDQHWRIVNLNLSDKENLIDWTHEREWRVKGDFEFEHSEAIVVLTNEKAYQAFIKKCEPNILQELAGIITLEGMLS